MRKLMQRAAALLGAAAIGLTGCSDGATGPDGGGGSGGNGAGSGGTGFARALLIDDPATTSPALQAPLAAFRRAGTASAWSGTFHGSAQVAISVDGNVWIDLGNPGAVTVDAQSSGSETDVHGEVEVPAGTYARVRLVLDGMDAQLAAGSTIGGLSLTADATVSIGGTDGRVVIEQTVPPFAVSADASARTEILFDLNSEAWITETAVNQQTVADAAVAAAARSGTRPRTRSGS